MDLNLKKLKEFKTGEDGAKLIFFQNDKYPPLMLYKNDGSTLYATRDLATDKDRLEKYGKDVVIINETGAEQALYFKQLFEAEKILGWFKEGQRIHVKHGHYRFKEGRMSTRRGNVIWLEDVLEEATKRASELGEGKVGEYHDAEISEQYRGMRSLHVGRDDKLAKQVGIGAIKWNDLKRDSRQDIVFDWDDVLNMQGNSGPYMQYVYARTQSVLRKSVVIARSKATRQSLKEQGIASPLRGLAMTLSSEEKNLLRLLARFGEVVGDAGEKYSPHILCSYLFDLAKAFNVFYQKMPILKAEDSVRLIRLDLVRAVGKIFESGLGLLGIGAPDRI